MLGSRAAAASDDLRALRAPLERELGVATGVDLVVEAPKRAGEMAEVGVDAQRELCEVTEPGEHSGHVVDGEAVDEERTDPDLLETAGRSTEEVALGRAPVLSVDAAHAVTAATKREPDREPGLEQALDDLERLRVADERQRLEQDEVRRIVFEDAGEELDRALPLGRVDLLGDRECDRTLARPSLLVDRLPCQPDAEPSDIHPVAELRRAGMGVSVGLGRRQDRPRVGRDHVAAGGDIPFVDLANRLWGTVEGPRAPELGVCPRLALEGVDAL